MKRLASILALALALGAGTAQAAPHFNGSTTGLMGAPGTNTTLSSATQFTLAAWVRVTQYHGTFNNSDMRIVSYGTGSGGGAIGNKERVGFGITNTGKLTLNVLVGADSSNSFQVTTGTTVVPLNTWFHAAAVVDFAAKTMVVYKDGAVYSSRSNVNFGTAFSSTPSIYARIGCSPRISWPDQKAIVGNVEDLQVYTSALSASDVFSLSTAGNSVAGITDRYPLNCLSPDSCTFDVGSGKYFYNTTSATMADSAGGFPATPNQLIISEPGPTGGL